MILNRKQACEKVNIKSRTNEIMLAKTYPVNCGLFLESLKRVSNKYLAHPLGLQIYYAKTQGQLNIFYSRKLHLLTHI